MNSRTSYLARIRRGDEREVLHSTGFLISSHWLVTAGHCLADLRVDDRVTVALVDGETARTDTARTDTVGGDTAGGGPVDGRTVDGQPVDGRTVDGRVVRIADRDDLGLVCITGPLPRSVVRPVLARAADDDEWLAPARPATSAHRLRGTVLNADLRHRCSGGGEIQALELRVDQLLGDYRGYSGGPIERVPPSQDRYAAPTVVGILLAQAMKRTRSREAANVLIAAQAEDALKRLDVLAEAQRLAQENTRELQRGFDADPTGLTHEIRELGVIGDELDVMVSRGLLRRRKARRFLHRVLDRTLRHWMARSNA
ncbi:trypsin-like serine protease [Plantactinospora sp. WMMC1484]|uniref:trypsin-like serine protease n=1 Tax=Plantactinospora sp. WMMC1484 TaxID=3404122 RepID=UPI003BF4A7A3